MGDTPFHRLTFYYSSVDWDGLCDHLRRCSLAGYLCDWVHFGINAYIPLRKYQVKHHLFLGVSDVSAATIAHRNLFLKLPNLLVLIKQKNLFCPRYVAKETFGELLVFWTQVNLLFLHYFVVLRYCLDHVIRQSFLLKSFRTTVILMIHVPLNLLSLLKN